jgi:quercetin dioxygenase-like cupin family protein
VFLKSTERTRMSFSRGLFEGLGGEQFTGRVAPFMLTLESGSASGPHDIVHTGHEFVFCFRGQLEYRVERDIFELSAGDSLLFASQLKHRWKNPGSTVTNALLIISGFAEGEQPQAMHWKKDE